jgi:hypothetical protein
MRKDDALVELADIKKDLPHWPDEVIKPWLRRVSLAKKTSTGVEPGCGGRGGPDDRHFPKRLANLNTFRAFGRTSAPPAQRFAGVRQSGSIAPPLRPSEFRCPQLCHSEGRPLATIRKRRDNYEVQAAVPDVRTSRRLSAFSSALRLGLGRWRSERPKQASGRSERRDCNTVRRDGQ